MYPLVYTLYPHADNQYIHLISDILTNGDFIPGRNANTYRLFKADMTFASTPLIHVRKTSWKSALREMEWFLSGATKLSSLHPSVQHWWKPWEDEQGHIRFNYSEQLRHSHGFELLPFDSIKYLINGISEHPFSRRLLCTTWNNSDMSNPECRITNCHGTVIHINVDSGNQLNLFMYQRSVDVICGLPHNLIQYWAFMHWLAFKTGKKVGRFEWTGGDIHIYEQHVDIAKKMLISNFDSIKPCHLIYYPNDQVNSHSPDDFKADDFILTGEYNPLLTDKVEMVV